MGCPSEFGSKPNLITWVEEIFLSEVQSTNFVCGQDGDGGRAGGHVDGGGGRHLRHHGGQQRVQLRHAQQVLLHPHGRLHGGEATARQV